eukprot:1090146-Prymnesium_polylepis.1
MRGNSVNGARSLPSGWAATPVGEVVPYVGPVNACRPAIENGLLALIDSLGRQRGQVLQPAFAGVCYAAGCKLALGNVVLEPAELALLQGARHLDDPSRRLPLRPSPIHAPIAAICCRDVLRLRRRM